MELKSRYAIVNAGTPTDWYPQGMNRLKKSLESNFNGELFQYDHFPIKGFDESNGYNIKPSAMQAAIRSIESDEAEPSLRLLLWLDCAFYAIAPVEPVFEYIKENGYLFMYNGYNAAQECSDKCLEYFNITRDEAEQIPMISSGFMGFDMNMYSGRKFLKMFAKASKDGVFNGSRNHDKQSSDPRFMHHRQDQSAASLIAYKLGMKPYDEKTFWQYDIDKPVKETTCFLNKGM